MRDDVVDTDAKPVVVSGLVSPLNGERLVFGGFHLVASSLSAVAMKVALPRGVGQAPAPLSLYDGFCTLYYPLSDSPGFVPRFPCFSGGRAFPPSSSCVVC